MTGTRCGRHEPNFIRPYVSTGRQLHLHFARQDDCAAKKESDVPDYNSFLLHLPSLLHHHCHVGFEAITNCRPTFATKMAEQEVQEESM